MTEGEWLGCTDPIAMLEFLQGKLSDRKLRLFACACCRWVWPLLEDQRSRKAVMLAELYADGLTARRSLERASAFAADAFDYSHNHYSEPTAHGACASAVSLNAAEAAHGAVTRSGLDRHGRAAQADLLRDIVFPRPVVLDRIWLAWADGAVVKLAQTIYEERRFEDLPILADALEEAGCTTPSILDHLRGPGPHTRGCWPVDLILGRE